MFLEAIKNHGRGIIKYFHLTRDTFPLGLTKNHTQSVHIRNEKNVRQHHLFEETSTLDFDTLLPLQIVGSKYLVSQNSLIQYLNTLSKFFYALIFIQKSK